MRPQRILNPQLPLVQASLQKWIPMIVTLSQMGVVIIFLHRLIVVRTLNPYPPYSQHILPNLVYLVEPNWTGAVHSHSSACSSLTTFLRYL